MVSGERIGPYTIVGKLGEGGMRQVFRATDTNLKRQVAIKVLPASLVGDADRLARFQREAEVLAALNHPNIAAIYGLEKTPDFTALVMELVEGDDLSQRIARGAIPIDEALPIAKQIAEALEAAHEQGIIHRDLKPANIKVRADGTVKVLDFGLAKLGHSQPSGSGLQAPGAPGDELPTITSPAMTQAGMILGTAAYMAPEQARGKVVDKRADIWAFGVVLFEMLTGKRAFAGDDVSDVLASVLAREPNWAQLPAGVPPHVRSLLLRCLQKDVRKRLPHIGVARQDLEEGPAATAPETPVVPRRSRWAPMGWTALGFTAAAALWLGVTLGRPPATVPPAISSSVGLPSDLPGQPADRFSVSPDGQRLAFTAPDSSGRVVLWIRPLSSLEAQPLAGTDGASAPFWSPDSRQVGFRAGGKLKRIDVSGGAVVTLADSVGASPGSWSREDVVLFAHAAPERKIFRVSAKGGAAVATRAGPYYPVFLPDGQHFLYSAGRVVYVGSLNDADPTTILEGVGNAMYASGHLVYLRETTLFAQKFDAERLKLDGDAFPLAERIQISTGSGAGAFSVSQSGVLVYQATGTAPSRLTWLDRGGLETGVLGEAGRYSEASLSADGSRVAVSMFGESGDDRDIWLVDVRRGLRTRVTTERTDDTDPLLCWRSPRSA